MLKILKSDYIGTIVLAVILFAGIFAFWFGLRLALQTEFPFLAVASESMEPFLYRGDLIMVQGGLNFAELNAAPVDAQPPGEVIIFYNPRYERVPILFPVAGKEVNLIVHRAVSKAENNGTWYFQTKGDNNQLADTWNTPGPDTWEGKISEKLVVGRIIGKVPWIGHVPLFMHENPFLAASIIILLFAFLIIIDFIYPHKKEEKTTAQKEKLLNNTATKNCVPKNC